jgi:phosphate transport system permease protein
MTAQDVKAPAARRSTSLRRGRNHPGERVIETLLVVATVVSIAVTVGIVVSLVGPTISFFTDVDVVDFLTDTSWTPTFSDPRYGVLPLVVATLLTTTISTAIALPLGLGSAIYLSEYASSRARKALKPLLEVLAGIPTVVYGFFALFALNPILQRIWPGQEKPAFQNILVASIAMSVMIVPTIASLSEDAMSAVPHSLREGAYALASTKMQVSTRVVVPAAVSGIIAAVVLGLSRAIGETMIVTVAGGLQSDRITFNPVEGAATMTAFIANVAQGDIPVGTVRYESVFAVGALLFLFTFILNAFAIRMVRRFREVYE